MLASIFRNIGWSKRPVSVSVDDPVVSSSATTATNTGTGDSSSNTGEEEDWDRICRSSAVVVVVIGFVKVGSGSEMIDVTVHYAHDHHCRRVN